MICAALALILPGSLPFSEAAAAAPAPAFELSSIPTPSDLGAEPSTYQLFATNAGAAATDGSPILLSETLPASAQPTDVHLRLPTDPGADFAAAACALESSPAPATVRCLIDESLPGAHPARIEPDQEILLEVELEPLPPGPPVEDLFALSGGGAPSAYVSSASRPGAPAGPGFSSLAVRLLDEAGRPETTAGGVPHELFIALALNTEAAPAGSSSPIRPAGGDLKDLHIDLPPGLVARAARAPRCSLAEFNAHQDGHNGCSDSSAIGVIALRQLEGAAAATGQVAIYNLLPSPGTPALFGFQVSGLPNYLATSLRAADGYAIRASLRNLAQAKRLTAARIALWGDPSNPIHDPLRGRCALEGGSCPYLGPPEPLWRAPGFCAGPLSFALSFETWSAPDELHVASAEQPPPSGCAALSPGAALELGLETPAAGAPAGLRLALNPAPGAPDLRALRLALPPGLALNPGLADGLATCTAAEIGLLSNPGVLPARFDDRPSSCPDAAKLASAQLRTPLLDRPLPGAVYLASPADNPFGSLFGLYLVLEDPSAGLALKLPGHLLPDPGAGSLGVEFPQLPQLPINSLELNFFAGPRAALLSPRSCSPAPLGATLTPWSAPESGPPLRLEPSLPLVPGCGAALPAPSLSAGSIEPRAGAYTPFILSVRQPEELSGLEVVLPPGLVANLSSAAACPEAAIVAISATPGTAQGELARPSCPAGSRIGSVHLALGSSALPLQLTGSAYLAGPHDDAPYSVLIAVPVLAGPLDLGSLTVRLAVEVDPLSARLRLRSGAIPRSWAGIPVSLAGLRLIVDRQDFILNPTSCNPSAITATLSPVPGAAVQLSDRFQVGGCAALPFSPRLSVRLSGALARNGRPALRAVIRPRPGHANIARTTLTLPTTELLDYANLRAVCSRGRYVSSASGARCPRGSRYGRARVFTPLIDRPLEGPLYLRSAVDQRRLPELVASLRGRTPLDLVAKVGSVRGLLRIAFDDLPDVPIEKVVLRLDGGPRGLLVNTRGLCGARPGVRAGFLAHNGERRVVRRAVGLGCDGAPRSARPAPGRRDGAEPWG